MRNRCWHPTALPGAQAAEHYAQFPSLGNRAAGQEVRHRHPDKIKHRAWLLSAIHHKATKGTKKHKENH